MSNREAGKGDGMRPTDHKKYGSNYDLIWGNKQKEDDAKAEDDEFERIQREQGEKK
jgi:hypothetical protein